MPKKKATADTLPTNPSPDLPAAQRRPRLADGQPQPLQQPAEPAPLLQTASQQSVPPALETPPPVPEAAPPFIPVVPAAEEAIPQSVPTVQDEPGEVSERAYAAVGRAYLWSRKLGVDTREFMMTCMELCDGDALELLDK